VDKFSREIDHHVLVLSLRVYTHSSPIPKSSSRGFVNTEMAPFKKSTSRTTAAATYKGKSMAAGGMRVSTLLYFQTLRSKK